MSTHWTEEEYTACEEAKTFGDILAIGLIILQRMKKSGKPIVELCGPMSTGGKGSIKENFRFYNYGIKVLEEKGMIVFDPVPFQKTMERLSSHLKNGEYCMDILEVFYKGIFASGYISTSYFLPGWQSSKGATWERKTLGEMGIEINEFPEEWLADFK